MVRIVCWNMQKKQEPWYKLAEMGRNGKADAALLQETGIPPSNLQLPMQYDDKAFWNQDLYDRTLVVRLSDRVEVIRFREVSTADGLTEGDIGVSGIGTIDAARVVARGRANEEFIAVSMYARWIKPHPSTGSSWMGASDVSAHRILSDLSAFIGHSNPSRHRILAAGDLNMFYGATGSKLSLPKRECTVWDRFEALGLEFLGPQAPDGERSATTQPDVPADTKNVPTYFGSRQSPETANRQIDYAFASRGFHNRVRVHALNGIEDWGPSDHCRLLIEVSEG